ncbi:hypothetical protein [Streptomyces nitrosporeus]|uniref:hypothetical protein n=1 Tax=Streptomyces nitrosporeus TaxID=28894 RepID=UPI0039A2B4CE
MAALSAEPERERQEHTLSVAAERHGWELAEAEAAHLREQFGVRAEHIADLQQALRTPTPAPVRTELPSSVPGQAGGGRPEAPEDGNGRRRTAAASTQAASSHSRATSSAAAGSRCTLSRVRHGRRTLVGRLICLVLTLAATSVQTLFPQDSPDRLTWWTNHRAHRHLRRNTRRQQNNPPAPPA